MSKPKLVLISIGVIYGLAVIVPVVLKLSGVVHWSWMAIAIPLWIAGALVVLFSVMVTVFFVFGKEPPPPTPPSDALL